MEALRGALVPLLLPEPCFEELLLRLNLLHGARRGGRGRCHGGAGRKCPWGRGSGRRHVGCGRKWRRRGRNWWGWGRK